MTWVLDEAPVADSTQTLVLLCLADWADDTGLCWPSIDSIARRARCSESTARRSVRALEKSGLVIRESSSSGRATNRYRIIRSNPVNLTGSEGYPQADNPVTVTPLQSDGVEPPTLAPMTANPGVGDTPTLAWVTPEPSLNPQEPPAAAREASPANTDDTAARAAEPANDRTTALAAVDRDVTPDVDAVSAACRTAGMTASFSGLSLVQRAEISALVAVHGVPALVAEARRHHRRDDPARFATAWLKLWHAMPRCTPTADAAVPQCDACINGWIENPDTGLPERRCHCRTNTHTAGGTR